MKGILRSAFTRVFLSTGFTLKIALRSEIILKTLKTIDFIIAPV